MGDARRVKLLFDGLSDGQASGPQAAASAFGHGDEVRSGGDEGLNLLEDHRRRRAVSRRNDLRRESEGVLLHDFRDLSIFAQIQAFLSSLVGGFSSRVVPWLHWSPEIR